MLLDLAVCLARVVVLLFFFVSSKEIDFDMLVFDPFYKFDYNIMWEQNVKLFTLGFTVDLEKKKLGSLPQQVDVWRK